MHLLADDVDVERTVDRDDGGDVALKHSLYVTDNGSTFGQRRRTAHLLEQTVDSRVAYACAVGGGDVTGEEPPVENRVRPIPQIAAGQSTKITVVHARNQCLQIDLNDFDPYADARELRLDYLSDCYLVGCRGYQQLRF